jgi:hypothetical protein
LSGEFHFSSCGSIDVRDVHIASVQCVTEYKIDYKNFGYFQRRNIRPIIQFNLFPFILWTLHEEHMKVITSIIAYTDHGKK